MLSLVNRKLRTEFDEKFLLVIYKFRKGCLGNEPSFLWLSLAFILWAWKNLAPIRTELEKIVLFFIPVTSIEKTNEAVNAIEPAGLTYAQINHELST